MSVGASADQLPAPRISLRRSGIRMGARSRDESPTVGPGSRGGCGLTGLGVEPPPFGPDIKPGRRMLTKGVPSVPAQRSASAARPPPMCLLKIVSDRPNSNHPCLRARRCGGRSRTGRGRGSRRRVRGHRVGRALGPRSSSGSSWRTGPCASPGLQVVDELGRVAVNSVGVGGQAHMSSRWG